MRIIYPYNEILPRKKAHDIFIMHTCAAFAELGWDVTLLIGKGSDGDSLFSYYQINPSQNLHITPLFILRKNNPFGISWNLPFFLGSQFKIQKMHPDCVFLSVRKQATFHLLRKVSKVRYIYEAHELLYYPNQPIPKTYDLQLEKMMLSRTDLVTVTTSALKEILLNPPYALKVPVAVIPLAVQASPLPPPPPADPLMLMYVGQLYSGQGLPSLLSALASVQDVHLKIVGGRAEEIFHLSKLAKELAIAERVEFLGFLAPHQIPPIAKDAHAFVAPFENRGRMPYVAHTKLFEYAEWGRPVIAPRLPLVEEHFQDGKGALLFDPGDTASLAGCIVALKQEPLRQKLQAEISSYSGRFSWQSRALAYATLLQQLSLNP
jgi:glycosyltransferase involved in cell wall biosynthesis